MGGFPAWLLRDPHIKLRSNYKPYLSAVEKYFNKVLEIINEYQFTRGGPIIALQFENEFGVLSHDKDRQYFEFMRNIIEKSGFKELLFNCDSGIKASEAAKYKLPGSLLLRNLLNYLMILFYNPGILETDNFNIDSLIKLNALRENQRNKPLFVSEFWPGWFDAWGDQTHYRTNLSVFEKELTDVLFNANASVNFYMFFGGTNFGFTNGGSVTDRVVTSYDYDSPLSESGTHPLI